MVPMSRHDRRLLSSQYKEISQTGKDSLKFLGTTKDLPESLSLSVT